jgi:hypothetical protein
MLFPRQKRYQEAAVAKIIFFRMGGCETTIDKFIISKKGARLLPKLIRISEVSEKLETIIGLHSLLLKAFAYYTWRVQKLG